VPIFAAMMRVLGATFGLSVLLAAQQPAGAGAVALSQAELDALRIAAAELVLVHSVRLPSLSVPESQVCALHWAPDGARLAVGWREGVGIVEVATGTSENRSLGRGRLLGAGAGGWWWWRPTDSAVLFLVSGPEAGPTVGWPAAPRGLAWVSIDGAVGLANGFLHRAGAEPSRIRIGVDGFGAVAHDVERGRLLIASNLHTVAYDSYHRELYVHELATGATRVLGPASPPGQRPLERSLGSVDFALDGRTAFAAGTTLRSFDVASGTLRAEAAIPQQFFAVVDPLLAIGHDHKQFSWWNCRTLTVGRVEPLPAGAVADIPVRRFTALSPHRDLLALVVDRDLWLYRIRLGR
jgi:hypothetical protein